MTLSPESSDILSQARSSSSFLQEVRGMAKSSLYFLTKAVLGFHKLTPHLHQDFCDHLQNLTIRRKLVLMPRGHYKTTCGSLGFIIWLLIQDEIPGLGIKGSEARILLAKETQTLAEHDLSSIEGIFDNNELFRILFPELIPDPTRRKRWNAQEMLVNRESSWPEATIETIGVGGAKQGTHYDAILFDDIIGNNAKESETIMDSTIDWFKYAESLFISLSNGITNVLGTRWSKRDVYQFILDKDHRYVPYTREAIEGGNPIFPEEFSLETLDGLRQRDIGHYLSQYCNNPTDPAKCDFKREWLKGCEWDLEGNEVKIKFSDDEKAVGIKNFDIVGVLDPSVDEKKTAARRAIVYVGMDAKQRCVILDTYASRDTTDKLLDSVFSMYAKWSHFNLRSFGVESVVFSKLYIYIFQKEAQLRNLHINVTPIKVSTHKSKESRIRDAIQQVAAQGRLYAFPTMRDFEEEFVDFPQGRFCDILDAASHAINMLQQPLTDEDVEEMEEAERLLLNDRNDITGY